MSKITTMSRLYRLNSLKSTGGKSKADQRRDRRERKAASKKHKIFITIDTKGINRPLYIPELPLETFDAWENNPYPNVGALKTEEL